MLYLNIQISGLELQTLNHLERKHLNVMYVGKPSVKVLTLDDMR